MSEDLTIELEIEDNPQSDYFKIERMSNSMLKHFRRSPRHYLFAKNNKETTPAMIFGSAFHTYVLENEKFESNYINLPDDAPSKRCLAHRHAKKPSAQTTADILWWDEFNEKHGAKIQLSIADSEKIKRMSYALYADPFANELMQGLGEVEKELLWVDDVTGIEMKGKLDGVSDSYTLDLKTCVNAEPHIFALNAFNMQYHTQSALYLDARAENKMAKGDFYFIALEKEGPYGVSVNKCGRDFISNGRMLYGEILSDFNYWKELGSPDVCYEWRAPLGYHTLNLPKWVK